MSKRKRRRNPERAERTGIAKDLVELGVFDNLPEAKRYVRADREIAEDTLFRASKERWQEDSYWDDELSNDDREAWTRRYRGNIREAKKRALFVYQVRTFGGNDEQQDKINAEEREAWNALESIDEANNEAR